MIKNGVDYESRFKRYSLKFHKEKDPEIITYLSSVDSINSYIRELIYQDLIKKGDNIKC